jgi:hypothetical protein
MSIPADLLPEELLKKRVKSTNHLWGWKLADIPQVVAACREQHYAILTARPCFFLPDDTCELYWKKTCPTLKQAGESWEQYTERNSTEFLGLIGKIADQTDFVKEAMAFRFLRDKKASGLNITEYLYYDLDIYTEKSYFQFYNNLE